MRPAIKEPFCFEADCGFSFIPENAPIIIEAQREGATGGKVPFVLKPSAPGYQDLPDEFDNVYLAPPPVVRPQPSKPPRRDAPSSTLPEVVIGAVGPGKIVTDPATGLPIELGKASPPRITDPQVAAPQRAPFKTPTPKPTKGEAQVGKLLSEQLWNLLREAGHTISGEEAPLEASIEASTTPKSTEVFDLTPTELTNPDQLTLFEEAAPTLSKAAPTIIGRVLGFLASSIGLAAQPTEAGYDVGVEALRVAQEIESGPKRFPITLPSPERLPLPTTFPIGGFTADQLPGEVVVTAPRVPAVVAFDPSIGLGPESIGVGPISGIRPTPEARPQPAPQPSSRSGSAPQPRTPAPLLGELGGPGPSRFPGEGPGGKPGPKTFPYPGSGPAPLTPRGQDQCKKQPQKQKKRKPRTVCHRGTYVERANGTLKHPQRKIPCQ